MPGVNTLTARRGKGSLTRQHVDGAPAHRLAKRMAGADLVRFPPPDAGVKAVQITAEGQRRLEVARDELEGFHRLVEDRLDAATRRALVAALNASEAAIRPPPWF